MLALHEHRSNTRLKIGEITVEIRQDSPAGRLGLPEYYGDFLTGAEPEVVLVNRSDNGPDLDSASIVFDSGSDWRVCLQDSRWILKADADCHYPHTVAVLTDDFTRVEVFQPRQDDRAMMPLAMPTVGWFIWSGLLGTGKGLILHASGVKADRTGWLFAGTDGVGKTTMARLWADHAGSDIIGSDQIIIRRKGVDIWMYSSPWRMAADFVAAELPVDHLLVLKQGEVNQLRQLSPVEATAALLKRSFPPAWFPRGMAYTVEFLSQVATMMPIYEYAFVPDRSAVDYLQECANFL